ncbi:MAG: MFS transporter [Anaerolineae bacterium]|jgi:FSR family fosmidomycin resistance protein-like MFS transporter
MTAEADAIVAGQSAEAEQFHTDRVVTISAGHAVHDTYTAFLPPLLPAFVESMSLSNTEAGLLTVFNQAPSLMQPVIGYVADRVSLRYLVILTPAVSATAMSLLGIAPSYAVLAMLLLVTGLSSSVLHAVAPVIAGRMSGTKLGRGMGFWMVGGELGRTLGPMIIAAYLAVWPDDLSHTPWLMFGGWLASVLLFVRLRDVEGRPSHTGQEIPWKNALRMMGPLLVPLSGIILVRAFMSAALTTYLPIFLADEGAALWMAGISLSVLEVAGVAGALLGGSLSDRFGRRAVLFVSLLTTPFLMLLFLVASGWLRFPLLLVVGFTALSVTPVIMALVQESCPENRALANGTYMSLNFLLRSGVVVVVGAMGDLWGMRMAFVICALVLLLGLPLLPLLPKRNR